MPNVSAREGSRRKKTKPALAVPASIQEAAVLESELAMLLNAIEKTRARGVAAKARIDAKVDASIAPLMEQAIARAEQLYGFAAARRAPSGEKTVAILNAGTVAWATSPHAVRIEDEPSVLERLVALGMEAFIRHPPPEVNREAMLDTAESRERAASVAGVTISQSEKVYVSPAESRGRVEATIGKKGAPGAWKAVWPKEEEKGRV